MQELKQVTLRINNVTETKNGMEKDTLLRKLRNKKRELTIKIANLASSKEI